MKSYKARLIISIVLMMFVTGCSVVPAKSPLQKRQITTTMFQAGYETTYRSILTVLQDQGYIIKNTDMKTGLISGSVSREANAGSVFVQTLFNGYARDKGSEVETSFMVNKINNTKTEVRINMQESKHGQSSRWSGSSKQSSKQILNPAVLNQLFNEIRTEIKRREAIKG